MTNSKSLSPIGPAEPAGIPADIRRQYPRNQDAENDAVDAFVTATYDENAESDQSSQSEYDETDDGSIESDDDLIEEHSVSLDDASDFGVSDVEKYIRENPDGWKNTPDPTDWSAIRNTGTAKKEWPKDMAIEAAFRDFKNANAPIDVENR